MLTLQLERLVCVQLRYAVNYSEHNMLICVTLLHMICVNWLRI